MVVRGEVVLALTVITLMTAADSPLLAKAAPPPDDTSFRATPAWSIDGLRLADPVLNERWRNQPARVMSALKSELGVDVSKVPVHVLTRRELIELHRAIGGRLGYRRGLSG